MVRNVCSVRVLDMVSVAVIVAAAAARIEVVIVGGGAAVVTCVCCCCCSSYCLCYSEGWASATSTFAFD